MCRLPFLMSQYEFLFVEIKTTALCPQTPGVPTYWKFPSRTSRGGRVLARGTNDLFATSDMKSYKRRRHISAGSAARAHGFYASLVISRTEKSTHSSDKSSRRHKCHIKPRTQKNRQQMSIHVIYFTSHVHTPPSKQPPYPIRNLTLRRTNPINQVPKTQSRTFFFRKNSSSGHRRVTEQ